MVEVVKAYLSPQIAAVKVYLPQPIATIKVAKVLAGPRGPAGATGATGPAGPAGTPGIATANFIVDGGGFEITPGVKGSLVIPFNCVIDGWTLMADVVGSIQIDIWKSNFSAYPPTIANSISPSNKATITSASKASSSTLSGWSTSISANDILVFNVDSVTTIGRVTIGLSLTRT